MLKYQQSAAGANGVCVSVDVSEVALPVQDSGHTDLVIEPSLALGLSALARFSPPVAQTSGKRSCRPSSLGLACSGGLSPCFNLPALRWRRIGPNELLVGQSLADDVGGNVFESVPVHVMAGVESEHLLVKVSEQVERLHTDVGSLDGALQQRPEVLHAIGVNLAVNVFFGMVNDLVLILVTEQDVGAVSIRIDFRATLYILADFGDKVSATGALHDLGPDAGVTIWPVPLQEAEHRGLTDGAGLLVAPDPNALLFVHVAGDATDESLVNLNNVVHLGKGFGLHGKPDAVEHEPSGLLSHTNGTVNLVGANAVLGAGDHPDSSEPLVQRDGAILENGSHLDRELPLGVLILALPQSAGSDVAHVVAATSRADDLAVRPPQLNHEVLTYVRIGEIPDGSEKSLGLSVHAHDSYYSRVYQL